MNKNAFSTRTLLILLIGNAILLAVTLVLPEMTWVLIVAFLAITLGMWAVIRSTGARAIEQAAAPAPLPAREPAAVTPAPPAAPLPPRKEKPEQPPEAAAIQILSILQREGRLIDFLQEDIRPYDDAQIGAAVRNVHEGCRNALAEYVTLEPVMKQPEGSTVTVEPGFDAHAIRLTGQVAGDPPFTGELRHRGWRVEKIDLPELMQTQDRIVAAAEVEVRG